jgi:hypothetical protein
VIVALWATASTFLALTSVGTDLEADSYVLFRFIAPTEYLHRQITRDVLQVFT